MYELMEVVRIRSRHFKLGAWEFVQDRCNVHVPTVLCRNAGAECICGLVWRRRENFQDCTDHLMTARFDRSRRNGQSGAFTLSDTKLPINILRGA